MLFLIVFILSLIVFATNVLLLKFVIERFKVGGVTMKMVAFIIVIQGMFTAIISVLNGVIAFIAGVGVFHWLMQRYYITSFKKNILIYLTFSVLSVIFSLVVIIPSRLYLVEPFYVEGKAMEPSYYEGDYLLLNKFNKNYQRGEVVIALNPNDTRQYLLKRVIGLPGEKIQLKGGEVVVFNAEYPNGHKLAESYLSPETKTFGVNENVVTLGQNEYYLLGDNRNASKDSRSLGPVSSEYFNGKLWFKAGKK